MAGNSNSGRKAEKPFRDALKLEIAEAGENPKALRNIAKQLIKQAESGDMQAIKEFADRIDGKVPQGLIGGEEGDPPLAVQLIELRAVYPKPDAASG